MTASPGKLYDGPDLAQAAARSTLGHSALDTLSGLVNAGLVLGDVVRNRLPGGRQRFEFAAASGYVPGGDTPVTAAYAGTGANRAWCFGSVFGRYDETELRSSGSARQALALLADASLRARFLFVDGVEPPVSLAGRHFFQMPAWIKQRLQIERQWETQLARMRRSTRQEAARVLRKYGYQSRLTGAHADFEHFYGSLYVPHMTRRFGKGAILVERRRFLTECRRGVLLQLLHRRTVVGASLLRRVGRTLGIVWSALDPRPGAAEMRGVTDAMDYFSVLYAHLTSCRWLDFGPSRPDLYDGPLRYKRKWGTELTAGRVPQATIAWHCAADGVAEREFLRRHAFVSLAEGGLTATAHVDGDVPPEELREVLRTLSAPGIRKIIIRPLSPLAAGTRAVLGDYPAAAVSAGARIAGN